jgi:hypothetical protein
MEPEPPDGVRNAQRWRAFGRARIASMAPTVRGPQAPRTDHAAPRYFIRYRPAL